MPELRPGCTVPAGQGPEMKLGRTSLTMFSGFPIFALG
jgi:hypothetical protein